MCHQSELVWPRNFKPDKSPAATMCMCSESSVCQLNLTLMDFPLTHTLVRCSCVRARINTHHFDRVFYMDIKHRRAHHRPPVTPWSGDLYTFLYTQRIQNDAIPYNHQLPRARPQTRPRRSFISIRQASYTTFSVSNDFGQYIYTMRRRVCIRGCTNSRPLLCAKWRRVLARTAIARAQ